MKTFSMSVALCAVMSAQDRQESLTPWSGSVPRAAVAKLPLPKKAEPSFASHLLLGAFTDADGWKAFVDAFESKGLKTVGLNWEKDAVVYVAEEEAGVCPPLSGELKEIKAGPYELVVKLGAREGMIPSARMSVVLYKIRRGIKKVSVTHSSGDGKSEQLGELKCREKGSPRKPAGPQRLKIRSREEASGASGSFCQRAGEELLEIPHNVPAWSIINGHGRHFFTIVPETAW